MVLRAFCLFLLLFGLGSALPLFAADTPTNGQPAVVAPAVESPALSELGSRSASLNDFVNSAGERLPQLADLAATRDAFDAIAAQLKQTDAEMQQLGSVDGWYVDRLNHYLNLFGQMRQKLDALQQRLTQRQQEAEKIGAGLQQNLDFWAAWEAELKKQDVKLPKQTILQAKERLVQLQGPLRTVTGQLLQLQEKIGNLQLQLLPVADQLNSALGQLRQATFRRNAYSLVSADFYQQFSPELVAQIGDGWNAALKFDRRYLQDNAWRLGLLGLVMACTAWLLFHYQARYKVSEDWHFILKRPLAAACFFTISLCWFWLPAPPALLRFLIVGCAVVAAVILTLPLLKQRRQVLFLLVAAGVFLLTNFLQLIAFPRPFFRLYIASLAVIFVPVFYRQVSSSRTSCAAGQGRWFRGLLRVVMVALLLSLLGQIAGYMNFSVWLIQAVFETGMAVLFARMADRLLGGGIELCNELLIRSERNFFKDYGNELSFRLKRLIRFFVYGFAGFYLLPTWRLFATMNEGWRFFSDLSVEIGNVTLTLQMLVSALLAFYLSLQLSWVLQAVAETQVLRRRNADRGVQDAVKKLIHYAIMLAGFLFALSMLGLGLQNFVVLLGAFGVGIGFGLQDIVNNFLSGLILLFERPIKVGDGVLIDGEYGTVTSIGMRSTVVKNLDEAELIVPNAQMISQKVTNWTLSNRRVRIVLPVGVAYGSDLEKVLEILSETARQHPEVLDYPTPTPLFVQFGASSLDFELRVWIANVDHRPRVKNELLLTIDKRFREEKIEIPFSQHDLHLRSVSPGIFPTGQLDSPPGSSD